MKRLSILGSTGSIGRSALDIVAMHPDRFEVVALAGANNVALLAEQINRFQPQTAVVIDEDQAYKLTRLLPEESQTRILFGSAGYEAAAAHENADTVLCAMVGAAGLLPALAAIDAGKEIALANKETLVMAGTLVMERVREKKVRLFPVDSEHSAIFQCLEGNQRKDLKKIFLTASGGPFREKPLEAFKDIKAGDALNHPTWSMGAKITIDSATLMNKGLEFIEAVHLFDLGPEDIDVLVHPQSIVHSMVGFSDGTVMAQMGKPDMKGAISYALAWPDRLDLGLSFPDFGALKALYFEQPDTTKFPSLDFARQACVQGGTLPCVMNAANEIAVEAFLDSRINFPGIFRIVSRCMETHTSVDMPLLSDILEADAWARDAARSLI